MNVQPQPFELTLPPRGYPERVPCQVCGETIVQLAGEENTARVLRNHELGLHHSAYALCERRIAEGWLPLGRDLRHAALRVGWRDPGSLHGWFTQPSKGPLQKDGLWCPGKPASARSSQYWGRADDLWDLVELLDERGADGAADELRAIERAGAQCNRHSTPWWIAWRRVRSPALLFVAQRKDEALGKILLANDPIANRRGDLTP